MASPNFKAKFNGSLHGVGLKDLYKMLDYGVKDLEGRKRIVEQISALPFFIEYFDSKDNSIEKQNIQTMEIEEKIQCKKQTQKENIRTANASIWKYKSTKDYSLIELNEALLHEVEEINGEIEELEEFKRELGRNKREREYFKANPTTKDILSEDDSVCQFIEKMANYLLFCDEEKQETKSTVMTERRVKLISDEREILVDEFDENMIPAYSGNYKLERKQKLFNSDYKRTDLPVLKEYKDGLDFLIDRKSKCTNPIEAKRISGMIGSLKETMVQIKDSYAGTIFFKRLMPETCQMEEFTIDFREVGHIKAMLECSPSSQKWWGTSSLSLEQYLLDVRHKIKKEDWEVLQLMRMFSGVDDKEIPDKMQMDRRDINSAILRIAKLIYKHHMMISEDLWYLNVVKGKYKTCSRCGEIKLIQSYSINQDSPDGYHSTCKSCKYS